MKEDGVLHTYRNRKTLLRTWCARFNKKCHGGRRFEKEICQASGRWKHCIRQVLPLERWLQRRYSFGHFSLLPNEPSRGHLYCSRIYLRVPAFAKCYFPADDGLWQRTTGPASYRENAVKLKRANNTSPRSFEFSRRSSRNGSLSGYEEAKQACLKSRSFVSTSFACTRHSAHNVSSKKQWQRLLGYLHKLPKCTNNWNTTAQSARPQICTLHFSHV